MDVTRSGESADRGGGRWFLAVVLALVPMILLGAEDRPPASSVVRGEDPSVLPIGKREEVEVHWVHYPVSFVAEERGGCQGLEPEMIEVTEDGGSPLPVAEVSRVRLPTIHAVLLDVSGSRAGYLSVAVAAATQYAEKIRPRDEMAVFTIGENLHMVEGFAPAGEVASRLSPRGKRLYAFGLTALWDGLDDFLRYAAARPERKAVILLTDGCDTASLQRRIERERPDTLFERLAMAENLRLFSVGLAVPK